MPFLTINGERREFPAQVFPATVALLLENLGFDPALVVAEVDGNVIGRVEFATCPLRDGQQIELVRFVGGG